MKYSIFIILIAILFFQCAGPSHQAENNFNQKAEKQAILDVLELQRSAWNNHSIDLFMEHYWKSDSMRFMTKDGVRYGWETTRANYKESYSTPEEMGTLQFTVKHLDLLSKESAYILGQWELQMDTTSFGGHFSLIWKKINGKWLIVTDHTS